MAYTSGRSPLLSGTFPFHDSTPCEPLSPVDPSPPLPKVDVRQTPGSEFFSSVFLDSPIGHTKPLRIRKRNAVARGVPVRRRKSSLSLPRTPRSTSEMLSRPHRSDTASTTASRVHHSISQIFMATSPVSLSPPPLPPKVHRVSASELHLGLGAHDDVLPGPSLPTTPALSPRTKQLFSKELPPSPVTPSRAPPKAAKLLGTEYSLKPSVIKKGKKDLYRPLPTQTLVEIERFLGSTKPEKPTKAQGTRHRGEDGIMWMDLEEEQEFAWLMADTMVSAEPVRPRRPDDSFIDFDDTPIPRRVPRDTDFPPWSEDVIVPPTRGASRPPLVRSDTSESDTSTSSGGSSRRRKAPPPPLKLKARGPSPYLPVISVTPEVAPETPFTRPRRAPAPDVPLPAVPRHSAMLQLYHSPTDHSDGMPYGGVVPLSPFETEDVSFFEPATPVTTKPHHRRVLSGSSDVVAAAARGGAWLKRVVGSKREVGTRI